LKFSCKCILVWENKPWKAKKLVKLFYRKIHPLKKSSEGGGEYFLNSQITSATTPILLALASPAATTALAAPSAAFISSCFSASDWRIRACFLPSATLISAAYNIIWWDHRSAVNSKESESHGRWKSSKIKTISIFLIKKYFFFP